MLRKRAEPFLPVKPAGASVSKYLPVAASKAMSFILTSFKRSVISLDVTTLPFGLTKKFSLFPEARLSCRILSAIGFKGIFTGRPFAPLVSASI